MPKPKFPAPAVMLLLWVQPKRKLRLKFAPIVILFTAERASLLIPPEGLRSLRGDWPRRNNNPQIKHELYH